VNFEWDEEKNALNQVKHGIGFEEAQEIFKGPVYAQPDTRHDYGENREISMGVLADSATLVVVHTDRNDITRLISARKANKRERIIYYEYLEKTLGSD